MYNNIHKKLRIFSFGMKCKKLYKMLQVKNDALIHDTTGHCNDTCKYSFLIKYVP